MRTHQALRLWFKCQPSTAGQLQRDSFFMGHFPHVYKSWYCPGHVGLSWNDIVFTWKEKEEKKTILTRKDVFLISEFSRPIFTYPLFPWGNEYYLQYSATILKVFSLCTIFATFPRTFSSECCMSFSSGIWGREKWNPAVLANSEPMTACNSVGSVTSDRGLQLECSWHLMEDISVSENFLQHTCDHLWKVFWKNWTIISIILYWKFSSATWLWPGRELSTEGHLVCMWSCWQAFFSWACTFLVGNAPLSSWHWLLPTKGGNFPASEVERRPTLLEMLSSPVVLHSWTMLRDSHHWLISPKKMSRSQVSTGLLHLPPWHTC